jgi:hypothetical protein
LSAVEVDFEVAETTRVPVADEFVTGVPVHVLFEYSVAVSPKEYEPGVTKFVATAGFENEKLPFPLFVWVHSLPSEKVAPLGSNGELVLNCTHLLLSPVPETLYDADPPVL